MYEVTLYVLGACCLERIRLVENEIKGLYGILTYKSSWPKGKIVIDFKPNLISSLEIIDRFEEQGFAVVKKVQREHCFDTYN